MCLPTYLEKCVAVLDADPGVVNCHSRMRVIDEDGNVVRDYDVARPPMPRAARSGSDG